jgi:hypothetical protein
MKPLLMSMMVGPPSSRRDAMPFSTVDRKR